MTTFRRKFERRGMRRRFERSVRTLQSLTKEARSLIREHEELADSMKRFEHDTSRRGRGVRFDDMRWFYETVEQTDKVRDEVSDFFDRFEDECYIARDSLADGLPDVMFDYWDDMDEDDAWDILEEAEKVLDEVEKIAQVLSNDLRREYERADDFFTEQGAYDEDFDDEFGRDDW